jgi:serine/threonine-protein kinase
MPEDRPLTFDTRAAADGFALTPGAILASRYEILGPVGAGGMGVVYEARDRTLDETVAIKVLRSPTVEDPSLAQRFIAEIKLARRVTHRNVCRIHDYGEAGSVRFISMQFVDGAELRQVIRGKGGLSAAEGYEIALQLVDGLEAIHHQGIIHRDLKTSNVMVDRQGTALLMDFGLAKSWQGEAAMLLTGSNEILGTPAYMSPEQARGDELDPRSDIYSLGVIVFELFTGVLPINAPNVAAMIHKKLHEPLTFDSTAAERLPAAVIPIIRKALATAATDRYASAQELRAALLAARGETPVADADASSTLAIRVQSLRPPHFADPEGVSSRRRGIAFSTAAILGTAALISTIAYYGLPRSLAPSAAPSLAPASTSVPAAESAAVRDSRAGATVQPTETVRSNSSPAATTAAVASQAPLSLDRACDGGDAAACAALAETANAAQRFERAADFYRKACDGNAAAACTAYGVLFNRGVGVTRDATQAAIYYERGCTLGDMAGCNNLGTVYQFGSVGFRDLEKASGLYERACSNGQMDGCANLGLLLLNLPGAVSQDRARARQFLERACRAGVARACGR